LEVAAQKITFKISVSGANKIKRLGARMIRKTKDLRFNNYPEAFIFGSFYQAKEQRFYFKIYHLKLSKSYFYSKVKIPNSESSFGLGIVGF